MNSWERDIPSATACASTLWLQSFEDKSFSRFAVSADGTSALPALTSALRCEESFAIQI
jgi:hypothetical protein